MKSIYSSILWIAFLLSLFSCEKDSEEPINNPPVANAGQDFAISLGQEAVLNGSSSSDPDGDALTYTWILKSKPVGSQSTLVNASGVTVKFTPDVLGEYVAELSVSDGNNQAVKDEVKVTVNQLPNNAPVANAGPAQTVNVGQKVALDGSTSADPDNDPLTYTWVFKSKPAGSMSTVTNADKAKAEFTPDIAGEYVAELSVSDGKGGTTKAEVKITVNTASTDDGCRLVQLEVGGEDSNIIKFEYNAAGYVIKAFNGDKLTSIFEYNSDNLMVRQNGPSNEDGYTTYTYVDGLVTQSTYYDENGNESMQTYKYDAQKRLIESKSEDGFKTIFTYDSRGNVIKEDDYGADNGNTLSRSTTYENFDDKINLWRAVKGFPATAVDNLSTLYNNENNYGKATLTDYSNGGAKVITTVTYKYNANGYPTEVTGPNEDGSTETLTSTYQGCK